MANINVTRRFALVGALVVALGCGGRLGCDEAGNPTSTFDGPNGSLIIRWGGLQGTALGNSAGGRVTFKSLIGNQQFDCELPLGLSVTDGMPLYAIPKNSVLFENAWLANGATPGIQLGLNGGAMRMIGAKPAVLGNNIVIDDAVAFTPNQYQMALDGPFQLMDPDLKKGLSLGRLSYNYDVFGNGFSNIPIKLSGSFPRNGSLSLGFSLKGEIPPNNGEGSATLELEQIGGKTDSFQTTKALGATTWSWDVNEPYQMPDQGLYRLGCRVAF